MDDMQDLLTSNPLRGRQDGARRQHRRDGGARHDVPRRRVCRGCHGYLKGEAGLVEGQVHRFRLVSIVVLGAYVTERRRRGFDFEVCRLGIIV